MTVRDLPTLNALLNSLATVFLVLGWVFIRRGRRTAHRGCMLAALAASVAFLTSYLVYHAQVGSVRFQGTGWIRTLYLSILASHTVLAAVVPILAVMVVVLAFRGRFERHRALARWTLPAWLYVSITGVVIYWMLYRMG